MLSALKKHACQHLFNIFLLVIRYLWYRRLCDRWHVNYRVVRILNRRGLLESAGSAAVAPSPSDSCPDSWYSSSATGALRVGRRPVPGAAQNSSHEWCNWQPAGVMVSRPVVTRPANLFLNLNVLLFCAALYKSVTPSADFKTVLQNVSSVSGTSCRRGGFE